MEQPVATAVLLSILSSGALTALVTNWLHRRKQHADAASVSVQTALLIEERAVLRYHSANEALDAAQAALNAAREQIRFLEVHVIAMHDILSDAGLSYELPPGLLDRVNN